MNHQINWNIYFENLKYHLNLNEFILTDLKMVN